MDLRLTGDRAFCLGGVCGHGRRHPPTTAFRDITLATIGEGTREVRLLVIARQCLVA